MATGFKYFIAPSAKHNGWEVQDDDALVMGVYNSQEEAEAAVSAFVHDDSKALMAKLFANNEL